MHHQFEERLDIDVRVDAEEISLRLAPVSHEIHHAIV